MNQQMNEYIARLRADALKMFPGATSVSIFINVQEVEVKPTYHGELNGRTMRTIDDEQCTTRDGEW